jgi:pyruvate kinase
MLNKGPYITDAVRLLDGILHRMGGHRDKRTPVWRPLHVAAP